MSKRKWVTLIGVLKNGKVVGCVLSVDARPFWPCVKLGRKLPSIRPTAHATMFTCRSWIHHPKC